MRLAARRTTRALVGDRIWDGCPTTQRNALRCNDPGTSTFNLMDASSCSAEWPTPGFGERLAASSAPPRWMIVGMSRPVERATLRNMLQPKEILEAALKLPTEQREELIEELSASLDAGDLGEYWEAEIQRRVADVDAGKVKTVPADEVYARLRQRFSAK
jgi:putative addiction module component (TIGR02574 family)